MVKKTKSIWYIIFGILVLFGIGFFAGYSSNQLDDSELMSLCVIKMDGFVLESDYDYCMVKWNETLQVAKRAIDKWGECLHG